MTEGNAPLADEAGASAPSAEYQAYAARLAQAPPPPPDEDLPARRARIDQGMSLLPLADGTSARQGERGGVPTVECECAAAGVAGEGSGSATNAAAAPVLVYFHGGGYRMGSALAWRSFGSHLARLAGAEVVLVDYRLAPENPFPAAVDDALAAYAALLAAGQPAERIVAAGDSAGGGLAAALLLGARERGLPLPAGAALLSPWADLTNTAASFRANAESDRMFSKQAADDAATAYLTGGDPKNPLASPVFGDWTGMPPLLIHVGDTEVLLDDAARLAEVARAAGVSVRHEIYPGMPHVWHLGYPHYPEAVRALEDVAAFARQCAASAARTALAQPSVTASDSTTTLS